jgi:plasmid stability protein
MLMAALQVKNMPEDLHDLLRERAEAEGTSISEVVLRALRRELSRPRIQDWLDLVEQSAPTKATEESIIRSIRESRAER